MKRLAARVQAKIDLFLGTTQALAAQIALTGIVVSRRVAFVLEFVLLVATVALGVMGLGLARTATVLTLLDRASLGVDVM